MDLLMRYLIRYGSDGIGLLHVTGVHAEGIKHARIRAARQLHADGYGLLAELGEYTVHGVRDEEDN
jgi:hypothetical protein